MRCTTHTLLKTPEELCQSQTKLQVSKALEANQPKVQYSDDMYSAGRIRTNPLWPLDWSAARASRKEAVWTSNQGLCGCVQKALDIAET